MKGGDLGAWSRAVQRCKEPPLGLLARSVQKVARKAGYSAVRTEARKSEEDEDEEGGVRRAGNMKEHVNEEGIFKSITCHEGMVGICICKKTDIRIYIYIYISICNRTRELPKQKINESGEQGQVAGIIDRNKKEGI